MSPTKILVVKSDPIFGSRPVLMDADGVLQAPAFFSPKMRRRLEMNPRWVPLCRRSPKSNPRDE